MKTVTKICTVSLLGTVLNVPAYSQSEDQVQAEQECTHGNVGSCQELARWAQGLCRRGYHEACDYAQRAMSLARQGQNQIRRGYPDRVYDSSGLEQVPGVNNTLGIVNGRGPGGAGYTNDAARQIWDGSLDPAEAARRAMGGR